MEIQAYKTRFKGKNAYGIPFGDLIPLLPVKGEEDSFETTDRVAFSISTHDRGDFLHPTQEFYQIVFGVSGIDEKSIELELDRDHNNPLWHDEKHHLWYQRTWFKENGRPSVEEASVDSINTAGVFFVILKDKQSGRELLNVKITVLPSLLSTEQYKHMLDRLLSIHGRLIVNTSSAVGIGESDTRRKMLTSGNPEYDIQLWHRLKPELQQIMKIPATLQEKQYVKMPVNKLKRFDSRVLRSYVSSGSRVDGIVYSDDYNSQENRLIKYVVRKLSSTVFAHEVQIILSEENIKAQIKQELEKRYNRRAVQWYESASRYIECKYSEETERETISLYSGYYQQKKYQTQYASGSSRKLRIFFRYSELGYEIRTFPINDGQSYFDPIKDKADIPGFTFYPFTNDNKPCGLWLHTKEIRVAYSIISSLASIYDSIEEEKVSRQLSVDYIGKKDSMDCDDHIHFRCRNGDKSVSIIRIKDVISCKTDVNDQSEEEITSLFSFYAHIAKSSILKYMETPREMDLVEFVESSEDNYHKLNQKAKVINDAVDAHKEIEEILANQWFKKIENAQITSLQKTPLFLYNAHYRAIYNILNEILRYHPLLTSSLEENLYGVHETALIFEYWVFYELVDRFINLGFVVDGDNDQVHNSLINLFVDHLLNNSLPERFAICMHRDVKPVNNPDITSPSVEVMLGFNCVFGDQNAPAKKQYDKYLTPDYFIRVTRNDGYHWYFLDAKYEEYSETMLYERAQKGQRKNSIPDVCYDKYTVKMAEKAFIDQFAEFHSSVFPSYWREDFLHKHTIEGAYLIVAKYRHESSDQITMEDRLFGNGSHNILDSRPLHRLGSIVFRPRNEDELTTLLELIFEYKEGSQLIETGQIKEKKIGNRNVWDIFNNDSQVSKIHTKRMLELRPVTLSACWDSSKDHTVIPEDEAISIVPQLTKGGRYKFYITCSCGARRYENYCISKRCRHEIIKHDSSNYHFRNSSTNSWDKWNYVCPYCGNDIDPAETEDSDNAVTDPFLIDTESMNYPDYQDPPPYTDEELELMAHDVEEDIGWFY